MNPRLRSAAIAVAAVSLAGLLPACRDQANPVLTPEKPPAATPGTPVTLVAVQCTGDRQALKVTCGKQAAVDGPSADIFVGGQNVYVTLTSSGVAYNAGTGQFTFTTTLQNLIQQPMGTTDGTTLDPNGVRVFFSSGPTVTAGTGLASVLPDGFATFLGAGQAYYQYNQVLAQNQTSAGKTWTLIMPPTVSTFAFVVYVSAPVEYPNGYIALDGELPGYSYGSIHPGVSHTLTAVARTAVGNVIPGAVVTFASSNGSCATVDPTTGLMTGIRAATCTMTASTPGGLVGSVSCDVTGASRTWNGSVSTDWNTDANWDSPGGGVAAAAPAGTDSVIIPGGAPNYPLLTGATAIGGVTVASGGSINLSTADLTASQNVAATGTGAITASTGRLVLSGTAKTVEGTVGPLLVTGTYSLSADALATAPILVRGGLLKATGFRLRQQ
ncbi:MAG: hypothetical protein JWM27_1144 [Gemmatimonadetes bacterium]|nr:hypothetical protein [Gemmatimonadota bacterium]